MTSERYRLERALWRAGYRVAVLPGITGASVITYPVELGKHDTTALERKLADVAGRLGVPSCLGAWLTDGRYSLQIPRHSRAVVRFADMDTSRACGVLPLLLGQTTTGQTLTTALEACPHVLIAGTTGSGKSNAQNAMLAALAAHVTPAALRFVLIDPKRVELSHFQHLPHTLATITEAAQAVDALAALTDEMTRRYKLLERAGVRSLDAYAKRTGEHLPRLVLVVDELAMLMDSHGKQLEPLLLALLQTARGAGIHCLLATQRPDPDTMPTRVRANIPVRVCFHLPDARSSQAVLEDARARELLGAGDGLLKSKGVRSLVRFQSPYIDDDALSTVLTLASKQKAAPYTVSGLNDVLTIHDDLPRLERAKLLCTRLEWINSTDLINAGICDSATVAKGVLNDLRALGIVGQNDPTRRASPVRRAGGRELTPDTQRAGMVTGEDTSPTAPDGRDGVRGWVVN